MTEAKHADSVYLHTCLKYIFDVLQEPTPPIREEAFSSTHKPITVGGQTQVTVGTTHISRLTDEQLIREFLSGSYCLHGVRNVPYIPPEQFLTNHTLTSNHLQMFISGSRVVEIWVLLRKARPSVPWGKGPQASVCTSVCKWGDEWDCVQEKSSRFTLL